MTEHKHENEGKKEGDGGASHHAKLDTPDAREARNASDATLQQALDLNPNKHSGSAGGNPDHGSFTLVAVTGNEVSVVASRTAGGSERDYINKENAAQITERELNGRADKGDFNAQLLVKELSELRRKGLSPAEESSEVANILGKATKIFPLREVDAEPPVAEAKKSETGRTAAPHLTPEQER